MDWRAPLVALLLLSTALSSSRLASGPITFNPGDEAPRGWGAPTQPAWIEPLQRLRVSSGDHTPRLWWRSPAHRLRAARQGLQRPRSVRAPLPRPRQLGRLALGRCQADGG